MTKSLGFNSRITEFIGLINNKRYKDKLIVATYLYLYEDLEPDLKGTYLVLWDMIKNIILQDQKNNELKEIKEDSSLIDGEKPNIDNNTVIENDEEVKNINQSIIIPVEDDANTTIKEIKNNTKKIKQDNDINELDIKQIKHIEPTKQNTFYDKKSIKEQSSLQILLDKFVEDRNRHEIVDEKTVDKSVSKLQLPDVINDNNGNGNSMRSINNVLSGMKIDIIGEKLSKNDYLFSQEDKQNKLKQDKNNKNDFDTNQENKQNKLKQSKNNKNDIDINQEYKQGKLKQDKDNKNDFDINTQQLQNTSKQIKVIENIKEKERSKEKENNNNINIYNNIYNKKNNNIYINNISENNIYSLERGCGGKPFLNEDSSVIDVSVLCVISEPEINPDEKISDAEAFTVQYVEPVSKPKKKKNEFVPPVFGEVEKYCQDKKLNVDTEHWYNYYEANDWKVNSQGKLVSMRNWKQALLTWHKNHKQFISDSATMKQTDKSEYSQLVKLNTDNVIESIKEKMKQQPAQASNQSKTKNIIPSAEVTHFSEYVLGVPYKYARAIWADNTPQTTEQQEAEYVIKKFINEDIKHGGNLILSGMYGAGKTHYSVLIGNTCYQYKRLKYYTYTKVSHLLTDIKEEFNPNTKQRTVYDNTINTELLILDEFGQCKLNEFDKQTIKDIIDDRYSNKLSTIFVTNKNLDEFFEMLDPSVASRLSANSLFLDFGKTDLRKSGETEYEKI